MTGCLGADWKTIPVIPGRGGLCLDCVWVFCFVVPARPSGPAFIHRPLPVPPLSPFDPPAAPGRLPRRREEPRHRSGLGLLAQRGKIDAVGKK